MYMLEIKSEKELRFSQKLKKIRLSDTTWLFIKIHYPSLGTGIRLSHVSGCGQWNVYRSMESTRKYLGKNDVWAWEECGLCCFWMKYPIDVRSNWLLFGGVHFKYVISDFLPTCCISPFWGMAVLKSPNTVDSYISPWDSVIFASSHIGWCSFVSCIHINNWYVLDNWHFPLYEMPLLYLS